MQVNVTDDNGPALLRVSGTLPAARTGVGTWWATLDGGRSRVCTAPVDQVWEPALPASFGPPWRVAVRPSPLLVALTVVGTGLCLRRPSGGVDWGRRVRWAVLAGWVVLAVNNIGKVPLAIGYDVDSHYQYVHYVAEHLKLPPADGGWQFFQAPLFYVVSAAVERMLQGIGIAVPYGLRVVPLACGMAVAELSYRAARVTFPGRGDLQAMAVAVGGLLPVNLYMAQVVSNEPMAAAAGGGWSFGC